MRQGEKERATAEIMFQFRHYPRDEWVPGHVFDHKSRAWIAVFNSLIDQGFIERRKTETGFSYRWAARFPDGM